jgi:hypothetical protein
MGRLPGRSSEALGAPPRTSETARSIHLGVIVRLAIAALFVVLGAGVKGHQLLEQPIVDS